MERIFQYLLKKVFLFFISSFFSFFFLIHPYLLFLDSVVFFCFGLFFSTLPSGSLILYLLKILSFTENLDEVPLLFYPSWSGLLFDLLSSGGFLFIFCMCYRFFYLLFFNNSLGQFLLRTFFIAIILLFFQLVFYSFFVNFVPVEAGGFNIISLPSGLPLKESLQVFIQEYLQGFFRLWFCFIFYMFCWMLLLKLFYYFVSNPLAIQKAFPGGGPLVDPIQVSPFTFIEGLYLWLLLLWSLSLLWSLREIVKVLYFSYKRNQVLRRLFTNNLVEFLHRFVGLRYSDLPRIPSELKRLFFLWTLAWKPSLILLKCRGQTSFWVVDEGRSLELGDTLGCKGVIGFSGLSLEILNLESRSFALFPFLASLGGQSYEFEALRRFLSDLSGPSSIGNVNEASPFLRVQIPSLGIPDHFYCVRRLPSTTSAESSLAEIPQGVGTEPLALLGALYLHFGDESQGFILLPVSPYKQAPHL